MVEVDIFLADSKDSFYPGETIAGHVSVKSQQLIEARNLVIRIVGKSKVEWSKRRHNRTVYYSSNHRILEEQIEAWERRDKWDKLPGSEFPFEFTLPYDLPPTFKTKYGEVYYKIKATIDVPNWFDKEAEFVFGVEPFYDLNSEPGSSKPQRVDVQKTYGFFTGDDVDIQSQLDKQGYAVDEKINCSVDVQNPSNRYVKSVELSLHQRVAYKAEGHKKRKSEKLVSYEKQIDEANEQTLANLFVRIPPTTPTFETPNIILSYEVKIRLCINGKLWDNYPDIYFPVDIGTVSTQRNY
ncbi:Arrestin-C domain-containing protein [Aphelenchoides bicaudatus]|nr:Arrestin-C domain-containing protein [Aphelenchoides bicaudatus]